eukprot:9308070-Pyramimonas_sp.AAC.1
MGGRARADAYVTDIAGQEHLVTPAEKNVLDHASWPREFLDLGIINRARLCGTRDIAADWCTKA